MDKRLLVKLAELCEKSYKDHVDLGHAEYMFERHIFDGEERQALIMPGSNEKIDWFWNLLLWSKHGVKLTTYNAARKVYKAVDDKIDWSKPLDIAGHSKAAPDALWFRLMYGGNYCAAFCPPPAFRRSYNYDIPESTIVIDNDDPVTIAGIVSFEHPKVTELIEMKRNVNRFNIKGRVEDHDLEENIIPFLKSRI